MKDLDDGPDGRKRRSAVTMVRGLRDGEGSGSSAHLIRQIKVLGARVTLAGTGRVTIVTASGVRRVYALDFDRLLVEESRRGHSAALEDRIRAAESPLSRALADLQAGTK